LLELDINVAKKAKKWEILHFSAVSSKFCGKWQIPQHGMKIRVPWNTAGTVHHLPYCPDTLHDKVTLFHSGHVSAYHEFICECLNVMWM